MTMVEAAAFRAREASTAAALAAGGAATAAAAEAKRWLAILRFMQY